jgi:hypothetical protein
VERRRFLKLFGLGLAGAAIAETIPLGRVWSFPKEIVITDPALDFDYVTREVLRVLKENLRLADASPLVSEAHFRIPQRWYVREYVRALEGARW